MKKNEISALKLKKIEELKKEAGTKKAGLLKKNDRKARRELAQILTIIRQKEIIGAQAKKTD